MTNAVLIVEDDEDIRSALKDFFEWQGFEAQTAQNGQEALDVLGGDTSLPCLIVLDYTMPVMNGGEFLAAQRADSRLQSIPVALMSAHMYLWRAEVGSTQHVFTKPIDMEALRALAEQYR